MTQQNGLLNFSAKEGLLPREEMLETKHEKTPITIGIPKENKDIERRVPLVPDAVNLLVENNHKVIIERGAGLQARFDDMAYADAGATLVSDKEQVYSADIILKIAPPEPAEIDLLSKHKTIFSTISLQNSSREYFKALMDKRVNAVAYDFIQDKTERFPVVQSMSEIVGTTAVFVAAEYLSDPNFGKGMLLGGFPGIKPAEVIIIGSGTVAEYAARTAIGMGASVKIFDNSIYKLRNIQINLGTRLFTSVLQPQVLEKALIDADVVISAKYSVTGDTACIIPEDTVKKMKEGSVIVDVSIDQGGCFETSYPTTHVKPVFVKHGVTHYCVPNMASRVPHTASYSLSNILSSVLLDMGEAGGLERYLKLNFPFSKGVYIFNGKLTNRNIGEHFSLPSRDLELILAAFH
jgi:alanine dehydrogenase